MGDTLTREDILNSMGEFTWFHGQDFFVETKLGNFHYKSPEYGGNNTLTQFNGNIQDFCDYIGIDAGRSKGTGCIASRLGCDVIVRLCSAKMPSAAARENAFAGYTADSYSENTIPAPRRSFLMIWESCLEVIRTAEGEAPLKFQLEVGKIYRQRNGGVCEIMAVLGDNTSVYKQGYRFVGGGCGQYYFPNGKAYPDGEDSDVDLLELYVAPGQKVSFVGV